VFVILAQPFTLAKRFTPTDLGSAAFHVVTPNEIAKIMLLQLLTVVFLLLTMEVMQKLVKGFSKPFQAFWILHALTAGLCWQAHLKGVEGHFLFPMWQVALWAVSFFTGILMVRFCSK